MNQEEQEAVGVLLKRLAEVIVERFGQKPTVPQDVLMPIATEVFETSEYKDTPAIYAGLNRLIDKVYGKVDAPST